MLELGGKNPTIVHASADLRSAARRIAYGRYLNSGHICTALVLLEEVAPGKTRFTYSVAIEPRLALRMGGPLARAHFGSMFRSACKGLQDYVLKGTLPSGGGGGATWGNPLIDAGDAMLGFELDFWDYATFATTALAGFAGVLIYIRQLTVAAARAQPIGHLRSGT